MTPLSIDINDMVGTLSQEGGWKKLSMGWATRSGMWVIRRGPQRDRGMTADQIERELTSLITPTEELGNIMTQEGGSQ